MKTINLIILLLVTYIGCCIAQSNSQPQGTSNLSSEQADQKKIEIDNYLKEVIKDYQIPGLAIAIVQYDTIYTAKAFGVKNLETKEPISTQSVFHMASVSKPFTATAIMQLVEQEKMRLDDKLIKYLPYFKLADPNYKNITIRQILTHTSGIPDVTNYEWENPQFDEGAAERYVRSLNNEKMVSIPGEDFNYSNMAFDILADVIAKVTDMTFEDYIKENILNPIGMSESDFLRERIDPELRVSGHEDLIEPYITDVYPYNRQHAPSSCLNANVLNMCNWALVNMNYGTLKGKRILQPSSYASLFDSQFKIPEDDYIDSESTVGLSWFIKQYRNHKTIFHGGGDLGFRSYIIMIPDQSLGVILASNFGGTPNKEIAFGLIDLMLGFKPSHSKIPISVYMAQNIKAGGIQFAISEYQEMKRLNPIKYTFTENELNNLGYYLLRNEQINDAIEIFRLNIEEYPMYANGYDSLAEAYMKNGQTDLAITNYKKSLELNPDNDNAKEMLEKLGK